MKKIILSLGLFLLLFAGFTADASAKDMSRRFGLGVDSAISSYATDGRGLSLIYVINKYFGMQVIFGMNTTTADVKRHISGGEIKNYDTTIIDYRCQQTRVDTKKKRLAIAWYKERIRKSG